MEMGSEEKRLIKSLLSILIKLNASFIPYIIMYMHKSQSFKNKDRKWGDDIIFGGWG